MTCEITSMTESTAARTSKPTQSPANVLMCAPTAYRVLYEINPWMSTKNVPDLKRSREQWDTLYRTLVDDVGARVELIDQNDDCPDMVFTANAAVIARGMALLARFRHPQRELEAPLFRSWFEKYGYAVYAPPDETHFEGEGDALFAGDHLLAGYLRRSDIGAHRWMSELLDVQVLSLQLADDRWYHLDTCLFALDHRTIVYYPGAFDEYARFVLTSNFKTIEVTEEEALRFVCNAVVIDREVVVPAGSPGLAAKLQSLGYSVHPIDMSEFLKAGGACKCLTLFLSGP